MPRSLTIFLVFHALIFIINLYQIHAFRDVSVQWCNRTDRSSLCLKILNADSRSYLRSSPEGMARIIVDRALLISESNIGKITDLIGKSKGTSNRVFRDCLAGYNQAHDLLKEANISVINRQTYHDVAAAVSFPYHKADECEQEFKQLLPGTPPPLTEDNKLLEDVIYVAMEIINLKVCNKTGICG
ncbi:uncharacterized protein [Primulina eburnea]|uniref:uncharacterized protein n=1 Tax=Primulina eburnea TaxID=1245227 RepID=UPI003C6C5093